MKASVKQKEHITNATKRRMIAVGIFFDLLPLGALALAMWFVFTLLGGTYCGEALEEAAQGNKITAVAKGTICLFSGGSSLIAGIFVGPAIVLVAAIFSQIMAVVTFTLWFYGHGVNIWAIKVDRFLTNLLTFVVEMLPGISFLPGITFFAWRHAKITQLADKRSKTEVEIPDEEGAMIAA